MFQPGAFVIPKTGYPLLCEVLSLEENGLMRVRGLAWPHGHTTLIEAQDVRSISELIAD
jgi:hypothetical protein